MKKVLLPVSAALIGLAGWTAGYFIARDQNSTDESGTNLQIVTATAELQAELDKARKEAAEAKQKAAELEAAAEGNLLTSEFKEATLDEIRNSPGPMDRMKGILAKVGEMSDEEIREALGEQGEKLRQGFDLEQMFTTYMMLSKLGGGDYESALEFLDGQDVMMKTGGSGVVLASRASTDPDQAMEIFDSSAGEIFYTTGIGGFAAANVARELARHDINKALAFTENLPEGAKAEAVSSVLKDIVADDPARASQLALNLPEGSERTRAINDVTENWAAKDPAGAFDWLNTLEDGKEKIEAKKKLLSGWARNDPAGAAQNLAALVPEEDLGTGTKIVANRWSERDPAGAADWLADQPDGKQKTEAMRNTMRSFTSIDPEGASVFLAEQPPGESRDAGIQSLSSTIARNDPIGAITWSAAISDENKRNQQVTAYSKAWLKRDEPAAKDWLETTDVIPIEQKAEILKDVVE
ncbi:MAG: hypothetical protein AAGA58_19170 [Verrucomicrobiota bacterium]